jgi:hypothetical protein
MLKRNGQVARHGRVNSEGAFDDQLSLFDFARRCRSKQIYLTQYGLMAERHWREFRPKMSAGFFLNNLFS